MNESRQAAILVGIIAIIGFTGLYPTGGTPFLEVPFQADLNLGDVYVDSYRADLYLNGTLMESYNYRITTSGKYRMLYRKWEMPLSAGDLSVPYVEPLVVIPTSGAIPYIKDNNGIVRILSAGDTRFEGSVQSLAELNEVGGYYPNRFPAGEYQMNYLFRIHPFLECDKELCHWNLMLASEHLPYREFSIYIHDPDGQVDSFFTHPEMESYKEGDTWVITGSSPLDEMVEVEMLLAPGVQNSIEGFPRQVSDIRETTLSAQEDEAG